MIQSAAGLRRETVPLVSCICLGLFMAVLPPLLWWPRVGEPLCFADNDEIFMLALGSQAYFNHPTHLSDPTFATGGASLYRQLPLLPGVWIAWMLGLGPLTMDLVWRILAGVSIPLAWYILAHHYVERRWVVVVMIAILLADGGILGSSLLVRQAINVAKVASGRPGELFTRLPTIHREWRIGTPALTMAYLVLHIWLVARARLRPSWFRLSLSGLSFGLLFYVYPFYWTAASAAIVLAMALDVGHRQVYFWTGAVGGLFGLPRFIADMMLRHSTLNDWLIRSGKFVPIPRLFEINVPFIASFLAVIGLFWVWTHRRDLIHVWAWERRAWPCTTARS